MNRFAFAVMGALMLAPPVFAQDPPQFTVLEARQAAAVLQQCSRFTPKPVTGTWQPAEADIKALEARLLPRLASLHPEKAKGAYYRQYAGVIIGKRKVIYINAFWVADAKVQHAEDKDRWRREPVIVCDGGDDYWGAVYDPATQEISEFEFNGVA
jgi:hypothetical protein